MKTRTPGARRVLARAFYARPTLEVLADIIGKVLVSEVRGTRTAGVIVEAEAYVGEDDPACHAVRGQTARNAPLYGPPGLAYVYLNYGLHALVNAVTEGDGWPAAVLIRALEPIEHLDLMRRRRARVSGRPPGAITDVELCRGPGNLTVALGITLAHNLVDLTSGPVRIEDHGIRPAGLVFSPRIGISQGADRPWRCHWVGKASVSGRRADYSRVAR